MNKKIPPRHIYYIFHELIVVFGSMSLDNYLLTFKYVNRLMLLMLNHFPLMATVGIGSMLKKLGLSHKKFRILCKLKVCMIKY